MRLTLAATVVCALALGAAAGVLSARTLIVRDATEATAVIGGWQLSPVGQPRASDWVGVMLARAVHAQTAPATLPVTELVAFESPRDADGRPFTGASTYILHFALDALPPSDAFWSLVARDPRDALNTADAPGAISSRATNLRRNGDGSLDIVVAAQPPENPVANWLATPSGAFRLVLRIYAPARAVREGGWHPPAVLRRETAA